MNRKLLIAGLLTLSSSAACAKRDSINADSLAPATVSATPSVDSFTVQMERGPCFGTCPMYQVSLKSTGDVKFKGVRFVVDTIEHTSTVSAESVRALREEFIKGNFATLDSTYSNGAKGCQSYHTDAPTVRITLSDGSNSKTVVHDHGCMGAPLVLNTLEAKIDSVANTAQWMQPARTGKP